MNKELLGSSVAFVLMSAITTIHPAKADLLTQPELAALTQSTLNDVDAVLLTVLSGGSIGGPAVTYTYSSTAGDPTWSSWSGALNGSLSGTPFGLSYAGTTSATTGSWSTTGTFNGGAVSGSGSSAITDPPSSFTFTLDDSLVFGGNSASVGFTLPGTILSDGFMLGAPASAEPGIGTISLNGVAHDVDVGLSFRYRYGVLYDDVYINGTRYWFRSYGIFGATSMYNVGSVPEPSTWEMLLLGFAGLGYTAQRKAAHRRVLET